MKNAIYFLASFMISTFFYECNTNKKPRELDPNSKLYQQVTHNLQDKPQKKNNRSALCYDGENLISFCYQDAATFEIISKDLADSKFIRQNDINFTICDALGRYCSPGGSTIENNKLWISDSYGSKLVCFNLHDFTLAKEFEYNFEGKGSKKMSGVAHDGKNLWCTLHIVDYDSPKEETQLLLKINPRTGQEMKRFSLPPTDSRDAASGLTWTGEHLAFFKAETLYLISNTTGELISEHKIEGSGRVTGIVHVNNEYYIQKLDGEILKLGPSWEIEGK